MSVFRLALPLLAVTFVNRMASLALSLLPAMLVAREAGAGAAALSMGLARGALLVGSLGGGVVSDRFGLRPTLVGSLALAGAGTLVMAVDGPLWWLVAGAAITQVGSGVFPTLVRLILVGMVPPEAQREALAWQRATANLGLAVAFGLGAALGTQVGWLLLLDASCSLLAAGLATRLPEGGSEGRAGPSERSGPWWAFLWATALQAAWVLAFEAYLTASSAQLREALGPAGVSWFSAVMLLNVVACAALGIVAARWIDDPRWSVPAGSLLLAGGAAVGVAWPGWRPGAVLGMALATSGELLFTATSAYVWMSLVPRTSRPATVFAAANAGVTAARAIGAALAFPLVVHGPNPGLAMAALALPGLLLGWAAGPLWREYRAVVTTPPTRTGRAAAADGVV